MKDSQTEAKTSNQTPRAFDFRMEEYRTLRTEIASIINYERHSELYVLGGLLAYYAWLLTHCIPPTSDYSEFLPWFIPIPLPVLGAWRSWDSFTRILSIAEYIREIEDRYLTDGPPSGWEHRMKQLRELSKERTRASSHVMLWILLIGLTLLLPWLAQASNAAVCEMLRGA